MEKQVDLPMRDGRASGTAFIVFASGDSVAKAVEMNEATFGACSVPIGHAWSLINVAKRYLKNRDVYYCANPPPHHPT
jgi:hypothetical protein